MNSPSSSLEHGHRAESSREELIARLYALLASHHVERQVREDRSKAIKSSRAEWHRIRRRLDGEVVASEELLDRLATMAYVGRAGHPLRLLLIGPPGAGKSHVAAALAAAVSTRVVTLDATSITEAGWYGTSLQEALAAVGTAEQLLDAAIVIEEVDKIRIHREAQGNAIDKYRNQQAQFLFLLDRAGRIGVGAGSIPSSGVHVILTGAFADASWARSAGLSSISREAMVRYGLMPELLDRIDEVIALEAPGVAELAGILRREIDKPRRTALEEATVELGYELRIEPSVYPYVARSLRNQSTAGTRVGRAMIEAAVQRVVASAIRQERPVGTVLRVTADDVRLPPPEEPEEPRGGRGRHGGTDWPPVRRR